MQGSGTFETRFGASGVVGFGFSAFSVFSAFSAFPGFSADLTGALTGDLTGALTGDLTGADLTGDLTGADLTGDLTGAFGAFLMGEPEGLGFGVQSLGERV